ncbi:MAG: nicotinamide-nucleotide amidohydrolase family protein [Burkholderiales bacterium]|nr:nicotinamide-nucleotide amidohydrolase family protein [Burkholderiales bacterium]
MDAELFALSGQVGRALAERGAKLVTAESCTGGWIGEVVTMVPGSSAWFDRGFITYSNAAKRAVLNVTPQTLLAHGAVSEATVGEMVEGAMRASGAEFAVAVSGVAGPGGGSAEKPVGMVCFGWGAPDGVRVVRTHRFSGDREAVRRQAVIVALEGVITLAQRPVVA